MKMLEAFELLEFTTMTSQFITYKTNAAKTTVRSPKKRNIIYKILENGILFNTNRAVDDGPDKGPGLKI